MEEVDNPLHLRSAYRNDQSVQNSLSICMLILSGIRGSASTYGRFPNDTSAQPSKLTGLDISSSFTNSVDFEQII